MPPEKKSLQSDLLDDDIERVTQQIKPKKAQPLHILLKSAKESSATQTSTPQIIENEGAIKRLRTYQSDIAEAVENKQESVVSISLAERKRAEDRGEEFGAKKPKSNRLVIALISLILLAGGAFALLATLQKADEEEIIIVPKPEGIIGTNKDIEFTVADLENTTAGEFLRSEGDRLGLSIGTFGNIRIIENSGDSNQISPERFLTLIGARAPGGLSRSLQDFMVGAYGKETGSEPFLIFRTTSFEQAFGGMLAWEKTIAKDLEGFFPQKDGVFRDAFIKNRDARVIKDESGTIVLLYSFLDSKTFVIAESENAFVSILNQFNTNRVTR